MNRNRSYITLLPTIVITMVAILVIAALGNRAFTTFSENLPIKGRKTIIIDAGHGGIDGGTTSYSGVLESNINLEISLRLNDLMHLLGIKTKMIRTDDHSVYSEGNTIAQQKVSDLKERVKVVNETEEGILVSIHQNSFPDSSCTGAQVFYNSNPGSKELAQNLQMQIAKKLDPQNNRKIKPASGIYLMENVNCCAVLIECGFLSNPEEDLLLCNEEYQNNLCCVIASTISKHLCEIYDSEHTDT